MEKRGSKVKGVKGNVLLIGKDCFASLYKGTETKETNTTQLTFVFKKTKTMSNNVFKSYFGQM